MNYRPLIYKSIFNSCTILASSKSHVVGVENVDPSILVRPTDGVRAAVGADPPGWSFEAFKQRSAISSMVSFLSIHDPSFAQNDFKGMRKLPGILVRSETVTTDHYSRIRNF